MATKEYKAFMDLGKEAGLQGATLTKWIKEQIGEQGSMKKNRNSQMKKKRRGKGSEKLSRGKKKPKEKTEDRKKPSRGEKKPKEKREEDRKKPSRGEKKPEEKREEDSTINNLVSKWTEDEPEQWLEEIEILFETYDVGPAERALLLTKHLDGKTMAAH
ncbi:uncharacterized protein [Macrobrachium rosenbergii]|uniref:uncharacterized protein n=1 Tax=Macrobrachium rosenbergii TaxID=79674 RepID=UPI0034D50093